jgi:hypothetical protein
MEHVSISMAPFADPKITREVMSVYNSSKHSDEVHPRVYGVWFRIQASQEGRCKATWKRKFKLWREAGSLNHHDDIVDSDQ